MAGFPAAHRQENIQVYVSTLRGLLGSASSSQRISYQNGGYVIHAKPAELDSLRFEQQIAVSQKLTLSAIPNATFSAVNNNGDIIGDAPQAGSSFTQPFILKAGGTPLFLNAPAGQAGNGFATADGLNNGDAEATSINATGVIVGDGAVGDGGQDAFISQNGTATDLNTLARAGTGSKPELAAHRGARVAGPLRDRLPAR